VERIDLNADLGESFGVYALGADDALLSLVTSANIACGFHAGDPRTMARTMAAAIQHGVALGAHPGLPDLVGFGRRALEVSPPEVLDMTCYQIGALHAFAARQGQRLHHVKPHGALYTMAENDPAIAAAIAQATYDFDPRLILVGLSGGRLTAAGRTLGLQVAEEVFADRSYQTDGTLTPRTQLGAVLHDPREVAARITRLAQEGTLIAVDGSALTLHADTLCLHGDSPDAPHLAQIVKEALEAEGVAVCALGAP
jgi:UPF0271 protein